MKNDNCHFRFIHFDLKIFDKTVTLFNNPQSLRKAAYQQFSLEDKSEKSFWSFTKDYI